MRSLAAVAREPGKPFTLEYVNLPEPGDDEILVEVAATGLCHTDVACRDGLLPVSRPIILGHEGAGVVVSVGSQVKKVQPGDHVVLIWYSCGTCRNCQEGNPSYCSGWFNYNFVVDPTGRQTASDSNGNPVHIGFFGQSSHSQYSLVHERSVVKVRKDVPLRLLGPLACGVLTGAGSVIHGVRAHVGSTIAIFGAGSVGLSCVLGAAVAGCTEIIVVSRTEARLETAKTFGATHVINPKKCEDVRQAVREIVPRGVDYAIDTSAAEGVIRQAASVLRPRGTLGLIGARDPLSDLQINYEQIMGQGLVVRGLVEGDCVPEYFIPEMIDLYLQGRFPFDKMLSFYPFESINEAIADQLSGKVIKPVLELRGEEHK